VISLVIATIDIVAGIVHFGAAGLPQMADHVTRPRQDAANQLASDWKG
jgi:hypothetical protein